MKATKKRFNIKNKKLIQTLSILEPIKKTPFISIPLLVGNLVSFISIPIFIKYSSLDYWSKLAIAQSLGSICAAIAGQGWNVSLVPSLKTLPNAEIGFRFRVSLLARSISYTILIPFSLFIAFLLKQDDLFIAIAFLTYAINALGSPWMFIGTSQITKYLLLDSLPRLTLAISGLLATVIFDSVIYYILGNFIGTVIAIFLTNFQALKRYDSEFKFQSYRTDATKKVLKSQALFTLNTVLTTAYAQTPIPFTSLIFPEFLPQFALYYKLVLFLSAIGGGFTDSVQGWLNSGLGHVKSFIKALKIVLTIDFGIFLAITVFAEPVYHYLSNKNMELSLLGSFSLSGAVFCLILTRHIGLTGLVFAGKQSILLIGSLVLLVTSLPSLLILGNKLSVNGLYLSIFIVESFVLIVQLISYLKFIKVSLEEDDELTFKQKRVKVR